MGSMKDENSHPIVMEFYFLNDSEDNNKTIMACEDR